jgi:hypothetical protein
MKDRNNEHELHKEDFMKLCSLDAFLVLGTDLYAAEIQPLRSSMFQAIRM